MSYLPISKRCARYLSAKTGAAAEKEIILTYAIEILGLNLLNLLAVLTIGWLLGVIHNTVICVIVVVLFRHTAGGAHSNSPRRCALVTIAIFPVLGLAAEKIVLLGQPSIDVLSFAAEFIALIAIILLAPVDCPQAPILSEVRRKKLKCLSILVLMLAVMTMIILGQSAWDKALEIKCGLALSLLWVSFILSRSGHAFMAFVDKIKI